MSPRNSIGKSVLVRAALMVAAVLIVMQATTFERVKLLLLEEPGSSAYAPGLTEKISSLPGRLVTIDWILAGILVVIFLWLLLREVRGRRLSGELQNILGSERSTLILLGVLAAAASRFYLAGGHITLGDATCHMSRVWAAAESLAAWRWPSWSFWNYGGYPLLQFYGPLFFVLTGLTSNVAGNTDWAVKVWLFVFHCGSAFPLYWWARAIGARRGAALVGAFAYVLTFQHTHTVVWTGALPVAAVYLLLPLLLLSVEKVLSLASRRWVFVLAAAAAGLVLTHQGYAAYGIQLALLYAGIRWILPGYERPKGRGLLAVVLGIGGGVLICAGFLWPYLAEGDWVHIEPEFPLLIPGLPTMEFARKILIWNNLWSGWTAAYMGVTFLLFAVTGSVRAWVDRSRAGENRIYRAVFIVALFAVLCAARSGRAANAALPFLAVLCGNVTNMRLGPIPARFTLLIMTLLFIDLGPTTIQSPYRTDRDFYYDGMQLTADRVRPNRILPGYASGAGTHYLHWGYSEGRGIILPTGSFPQGAPRSLNSITATIDALNAPGDTLSIARIDFLYLWDVAALVTYTRDRFVAPDIRSAGVIDGKRDIPTAVRLDTVPDIPSTGIVDTEPDNPPAALLAHVSPIVYSERVAVAVDDTLESLQREALIFRGEFEDDARRTFRRRMARWVSAMGLSRGMNRAEMIFLAPGVERNGVEDGAGALDTSIIRVRDPIEAMPEDPAGEGSLDAPHVPEERESVRVSEYAVSLREVKITYDCTAPGYLRLSFSWYPTLEVLMDGEPVEPLESLLGAVVIRTERGEHTVRLVPSRSRSSILAAAIGLVAGIAVILAAARFRV